VVTVAELVSRLWTSSLFPRGGFFAADVLDLAADILE